MARVLCVANQKGGVGKTTTALNLAAALAKADCRTLLVDLDPQCNATSGLGRQPTARHSLVQRRPLRESLCETDTPNLQLSARMSQLSGCIATGRQRRRGIHAGTAPGATACPHSILC